jgi:hypothetical protein
MVIRATSQETSNTLVMASSSSSTAPLLRANLCIMLKSEGIQYSDGVGNNLEGEHDDL